MFNEILFWILPSSLRALPIPVLEGDNIFFFDLHLFQKIRGSGHLIARDFPNELLF
jgi:hypothetical protein